MKGREHKYSPYDLAIFSKFINLNQLYIEGNNLCGLFKSLKNLTKLEILGTNIVSGLEFLPNNLKLIYSNDEEIGRILGKELRIQYGAKCYDYEF
jgi:hypothetical protein